CMTGRALAWTRTTTGAATMKRRWVPPVLPRTTTARLQSLACSRRVRIPIVRGVDEMRGVGLVEVYKLPAK
ncbi:MAG TPA: hypothetical protein VK993_06670, partial [Chthoniobacterales bacterium]|nr:hypothetical protein [Chthoniobacterales bacterium]